MFLQDIQEYKLQDIDDVDIKSLTKRIKYRQNLIKDLRERFRSEYLGTLTQRAQKRQPRISFNWLILGRDGEVRLDRVQTSINELLRPIQRIYPLEIATSNGPQYLKSIKSMDHSEESDQFNDTTILEHTPIFSKSGRRLKVLSPERLNL
ncbi:integrase catalytic domain-containing protein [Trichonephila clavipes]|nr:integrase catalytic domain-containing protein [Trichonephila clavipes]